ncbi:pyroglutamyl-peptidase I [Roseateles cellulosilyticus]|uniref:Pyrrolidone-carboxylate peptidase n=1 Tax=Pelomonas cellulosilytica TaxID=2906762 RepID=A0ABS8XZ15_9BURK|nr:pyroglutamyl-peptidase I [Pelomonas sp. P8]MCE4555861.1 pyroglutamyl-peptidase I [Pelomonas sp. P8]
MNILLTGFEPFGGEVINPSWEVARSLHGQIIAGATVHARCLPTSFSGAPVALTDALAVVRPLLVVAMGQASGRSEVSFERVAVNLIDARIADNAGDRLQDVPVRPGAPDGYFTTLPVKAMRDALRAAGYPAGLSLSAGAFVCNQVFYELQHRLAGSTVRSGFIHLPALPEQAARTQPSVPSMGLAAQVDAVRLALAVALTADARQAVGPDEGAPVS